MEGYVVGGGSGREIPARASGGRVVDGISFRGGRSDGGDGKSGESGRAAGRRRGFFRAEIDEDGEGKNNDYGAKDDEDERRRGPTEEEGAGGDAGGGVVPEAR